MHCSAMNDMLAALGARLQRLSVVDPQPRSVEFDYGDNDEEYNEDLWSAIDRNCPQLTHLSMDHLRLGSPDLVCSHA
jgi:hypothetical protein